MMDFISPLLPKWNKKKDAASAKDAQHRHIETDDEIRAREARERLKHVRRLRQSDNSNILDCICPIWVIAFLLVIAVSFTPLFSSFMAIWVVRKRVDDLVPKNLNVTAVDAAFAFTNTFARPIRDSAGGISDGLYDELQEWEWDRRERAKKDQIAWGPVYAKQKYNLPTLTDKQEAILERLCNGWMEKLEDGHKLMASTRSSRLFPSKHHSQHKPTNGDDDQWARSGKQCEASQNCFWTNISENIIVTTPYDNSSGYVHSSALARTVDDLSNLPKELWEKNVPNISQLQAMMDAFSSSDDPAGGGGNNEMARKFAESLNFQSIYSAIDSLVRRAPVGVKSDFIGNGFVSLWGVDINESGSVFANKDANSAAYVKSLGGSRGLNFFCGWKYSGMRSARTVGNVAGGNKNELFSNFSWLAAKVPWSSPNPNLVKACTLECGTTYFGVFNVSPPRTTEPGCDCSTNATSKFNFGAAFEASVTVLRPTKWKDVPKRPVPMPASHEITSAKDGRRIFLPSHIANYTPNYLWLDVAQTFDSFSLLRNFSHESLIDRTVSLASLGGTGTFNHLPDWVSYNLSFNITMPTMVTTPPQLRIWSTMMDYMSARTTLLDSDMVSASYVAAKTEPPMFDSLSGRMHRCAVPRWWYSVERVPAPCGGVEDSFASDTITLYRVTPVVLKRQMIRDSGLYSETPVRVANVVAGRRIPLGLIEKTLWPLAKQSAFQFSLVDASSMREIICVDGSSPDTSAALSGTVGIRVRSVWSTIWNSLAPYVPDNYIPLAWRYPVLSDAATEDHNTDWFLRHGHNDAAAANNAQQQTAHRESSPDSTTGERQKMPSAFHRELLPPSARCHRSTTFQTLEILSGRGKTATGGVPFVDEDRTLLTSIEDFLTKPRVVFSEAYLFAVPISLEDANTKAYSPTEDLERTVCESYNGDAKELEYDFNREQNQKAADSNSTSLENDVSCGGDRNDMLQRMLSKIEHQMKVHSNTEEEIKAMDELLTTSSRTAEPTPDPTKQNMWRAKKNKGNLYLFISLQSRDLLQLVLKSRSQVVVTSAVCAFIIVIALFIIVRGLTGPIKQLKRVLHGCSELSWEKVVTVNASVISEVLELQFAMSYITVRMQSFARFLPPGLRRFGEAAQNQVHIDSKSRRIYSTLEEGGSSSSDDDAGAKDIADQSREIGYKSGASGLMEHRVFSHAGADDLEDDRDYEDAINENEMKDLEFSGRSTSYARQLAYSLMGPSGLLRARKEAARSRRQAWRRTSMFHQSRERPRDAAVPIMTAERLGLSSSVDALSQETPQHSIYVNVTYEGVPVDIWAEESEKVQRRVLSGEYVRDHNLGRSNVWDEKPHLSTKFLLKYRATDPLIPLVGRACREVLQERPGEMLLIFVDAPDGKAQIVHNEDLLFAFEDHASKGTLSPIEITVTKRKPPTSHTIVLVLLTIGGTISRIALAFDRMGDEYQERMRLIGVLLIACLTMQIAMNTLLYVYLLAKMSKLDLEFHMWRQCSVREERLGYILSLFGIANMEFLGSYKQIPGDFKLTAPFTELLIRYLRRMTFVSMIFSDFFPLIILWVETVLRQSYDDAAMWFVTLFGFFGIFAVLNRHQMLTLYTNVKPQGDRADGPFTGKQRPTAALSRKEATVVRLRVAHGDALLSTLDMHHVDTLCEAIYSIVSPIVRSAGGILIRTDGLSFTVVFNAASNTPFHAAAAYSFVSLVSLAIRKHMAPLLGVHSRRYWQLRNEEVKDQVLQEYCATWYRVVAGIVTAEMAVGYSGTASLRTYQHADWTNHFAGALADLAEHYGAEILVNEQCAKELDIASEPTGVLARRPALVRHIDIAAVPLLDPEITRLTSDGMASEYNGALRKEKIFEALIRGLPIHNNWKIPKELAALYSSGFNYPYDDACAALILAHAKVNGAYEFKDPHTGTGANQLLESAAVKVALGKFAQATEQVFVCQEPRLLQQFCKEYPLDEVAHRVHRWARFFGSPNQSEGIVFPRLITGMGTQPHPCELLHGVGSQTTHTAASAKKTARFHLHGRSQSRAAAAASAQNSQPAGADPDADGSQNSSDEGSTHHHNDLAANAVAESRRFFDLAPLVRPPRSERRLAEAGRGAPKIALIDSILDKKQFQLSFHDRDADEPINEL